MKSILVPTDYSETADNALQYAIELAKFTEAKLILFHSYHIPVPTAEAPVVLISPDELENENIAKIKSLEKKILKETSGKLKVESIVRPGFVSDEIQSIVEEKNPSLIIMGITGAGKAAQVLIGSNTTSVMKKIHTPLLIIPKQAKYKKVEKILLACDYNSEMDEDVLEKIKRYVQLFKAKLYVIDVITHEAVPAYENTIAEFKLEHSLREIPHTTFFPHSENISDEINSFADYYKYDWLVMMPHKHKFPDSLFHKSNTKQMAFHTHIPLLTIHD